MASNNFIKQYPDLMVGKKIMYVHGFASSARSGTVTRLRDMLPSATVVAEDIPVHPAEGFDMLQRMAETEHPDLIIGTSMGGMYTEMLYGFDRILINPAFKIADTMGAHGMTGKQVFQNPRKDGIQEFLVTKSMVKEYGKRGEEFPMIVWSPGSSTVLEERQPVTRNGFCRALASTVVSVAASYFTTHCP